MQPDTSIDGHFDRQGNPCLKLYLCGSRHDPPGIEFEGIIDTGFTGFIQIPMRDALTLALPLETSTQVTLADASSLVMLAATAQATIRDRSQTVVLLSETSDDILLGMDFLRQFDQTLTISNRRGVRLVEDSAASHEGSA